MGGSGKTTVARRLGEIFGDSCVLYFDEYEFPREPDHLGEWVDNGADPDEWDMTPMVCDVEKIVLCGEKKYCIIDYPFGKKDYPMKKFIDFAVWMETPPDLALARRILRDFSDSDADEIRFELKAYAGGVRKYFILNPVERVYYDYFADGTKKVDEICADIISEIEKRV